MIPTTLLPPLIHYHTEQLIHPPQSHLSTVLQAYGSFFNIRHSLTPQVHTLLCSIPNKNSWTTFAVLDKNIRLNM